MTAVTGQPVPGESRLRLTVRELLAEPCFRLQLVAGSAGLDLPVRWAHSTELLDPGPYLRGYEIVLTVGAALTDPGRCRAFARSVRASRASAIGYGIADVTPDAPQALRKACDQLGLPLFEVPPEVPFVSFTEWLAERLAAVHDEEHDRAETGRLLELIRSELASPEAIRSHLEQAGLEVDLLVAAAVPALSIPARFTCPPGTLLGVAGDVALLVVPEEERAAALAAGWDDAPCGIGSPGPFTHLPRSLTECLAGLDLARRRGGPVRAGDLATFPALLGRLSPRQIAPFVEQIARPLGSYDAAHGSRLIDTLRAFLDSGGSVSATSRALFLHPNTLRHRLTRIEAITGRNPLQFEDRVALAVAMWAWKP
ncbi:MAG: Transcriptional regulator, CdaR family [Actinomycetia bacterium]|nr:Transcriptional regulator, CdaR family [Actinomycetes bacterium]